MFPIWELARCRYAVSWRTESVPGRRTSTETHSADTCRAADRIELVDNGPQSTDRRSNLTLLDEQTLRLLTNADLLSIDQIATASRQVLRDGDLVVWTADLPGDRHALAAFNHGEKPMTVDRELASLNLREGQYNAKNVWTGERLHLSSRLTATLEPHSNTVTAR